MDLDPKDEATRIKLAKLLLSGGAAQQSLKLLDASTEPDTNNASLLALKAVLHYKLKDTDIAIGDAQSALKIEPGNIDALIVLAADRLANNDPTGALQFFSVNPQSQDKDLGTELFKLKNLPTIERLCAGRIAAQDLGRALPAEYCVPKTTGQFLYVSASARRC